MPSAGCCTAAGFGIMPSVKTALFLKKAIALVIASVLGASNIAVADGVAHGYDDWIPKFYPGLEADGKVTFSDSGFRGEPSVELVWTSGMPKFGVAKRFASELKGVVDWTVSAYVKCGAGGRVAAAMEFFDAAGRSLGIVNGILRSFTEWTRLTWKFTSPRAAV